MGQRGLVGDVVHQQEDQLLLPLEGAPEGQVDVRPLSLDVGLRKGWKLIALLLISMKMNFEIFRLSIATKD